MNISFSQQANGWHGRLQGVCYRRAFRTISTVTSPVSTATQWNLRCASEYSVAILARKVPSSVVILRGLDGVEIVAELAQRADSRNRAEIRIRQIAAHLHTVTKVH
jgi:hypothetical protein